MSAAPALPASFGPWSRRARLVAAAFSNALAQNSTLNARLDEKFRATLRDSQTTLFAFKTPLDEIVFPAYLTKTDLDALRANCTPSTLAQCLTDKPSIDKRLGPWLEERVKRKDPRLCLYLESNHIPRWWKLPGVTCIPVARWWQPFVPRRRTALVVTAIGLAAAMIAVAVIGWPTTTSATITDPADGATVESVTYTARGTFAPGRLADPLWVVVVPDLAPNTAYPQSSNPLAGDPVSKSRGSWSVDMTLGGPPQGYRIDFYAVTDAASSAVFAQDVRNGSRGLAITPRQDMTLMPTEGVTLLDSIRITRSRLAVVTEPAGGTTVSRNRITMQGTYAKGLNDDIWVVLWPRHEPGMGRPQSPDFARGLPATKDPLRLTWSVPIVLDGDPKSAEPLEYDIRVYYAERAASDRLGHILTGWVATKAERRLGAAELPPGFHEQHKITIRWDRGLAQTERPAGETERSGEIPAPATPRVGEQAPPGHTRDEQRTTEANRPDASKPGLNPVVTTESAAPLTQIPARGSVAVRLKIWPQRTASIGTPGCASVVCLSEYVAENKDGVWQVAGDVFGLAVQPTAMIDGKAMQLRRTGSEWTGVSDPIATGSRLRIFVDGKLVASHSF
jgi:hypothetical protein